MDPGLTDNSATCAMVIQLVASACETHLHFISSWYLLRHTCYVQGISFSGAFQGLSFHQYLMCICLRCHHVYLHLYGEGLCPLSRITELGWFRVVTAPAPNKICYLPRAAPAPTLVP